jgi:hypothetical protein
MRTIELTEWECEVLVRALSEEVGRKWLEGRRVVRVEEVEGEEEVVRDDEMVKLVSLGNKLRDGWDGYDGVEYDEQRGRYKRIRGRWGKELWRKEARKEAR